MVSNLIVVYNYNPNRNISDPLTHSLIYVRTLGDEMVSMALKEISEKERNCQLMSGIMRHQGQEAKKRAVVSC